MFGQAMMINTVSFLSRLAITQDSVQRLKPSYSSDSNFMIVCEERNLIVIARVCEKLVRSDTLRYIVIHDIGKYKNKICRSIILELGESIKHP